MVILLESWLYRTQAPVYLEAREVNVLLYRFREESLMVKLGNNLQEILGVEELQDY